MTSVSPSVLSHDERSSACSARREVSARRLGDSDSQRADSVAAAAAKRRLITLRHPHTHTHTNRASKPPAGSTTTTRARRSDSAVTVCRCTRGRPTKTQTLGASTRPFVTTYQDQTRRNTCRSMHSIFFFFLVHIHGDDGDSHNL